jgi:hypothetical protein
MQSQQNTSPNDLAKTRIVIFAVVANFRIPRRAPTGDTPRSTIPYLRRPYRVFPVVTPCTHGEAPLTISKNRAILAVRKWTPLKNQGVCLLTLRGQSSQIHGFFTGTQGFTREVVCVRQVEASQKSCQQKADHWHFVCRKTRHEMKTRFENRRKASGKPENHGAECARLGKKKQAFAQKMGKAWCALNF